MVDDGGKIKRYRKCVKDSLCDINDRSRIYGRYAGQIGFGNKQNWSKLADDRRKNQFKHEGLICLNHPQRRKDYSVIKIINDMVYRICRSPRAKMKVEHLEVMCLIGTIKNCEGG